MSKFEIEICVDSVASAVAAAAGGAGRVELCQNLFEGGTTPSLGAIEVTRARISCGLHVIVRPRGGDFCYSPDELSAMERDIEHAKAAGADGVVLGLLKPDGRIDERRAAKLIRLARPLSVTFHRAFDMAGDPFDALERIIELGCERLLTSGQRQSVLEGSELIRELIDRAGRRLIVMPGGGITPENFERVRRLCGAREYHLAVHRRVESKMRRRNPHCFMGGELRPPEYEGAVTDEAAVRAIRSQSEA